MMEGDNPLIDALNALTKRIRVLETQERSEVTGGVETVVFADLPAAGQRGRGLFVSDGRKTGEGAGLGTGVQVYDDGTIWARVDDGTAVAA